MEKLLIIDNLIKKLAAELNEAKAAYQKTQETIKSGDLKSDGKYDTRATELNYLADGQRQRVTDLESEIELIKEIPRNVNSSEEQRVIGIGSLVELTFNGVTKKYFLSPTAGGTILTISGQPIMVISVFSPIGSSIIGLGEGETAEVEINSTVREYEINSFIN